MEVRKRAFLHCFLADQKITISSPSPFLPVPNNAVFHGVCEIALTEVLATQMGVAQQETTHKSYQSSVLSQLYFPTAIASHNSIFPQLYFLARALFSHSSTQSRGKTELFHTKP